MHKVVITYGTFDLLHQGHINILKRAKSLGEFLIVGVTTKDFDDLRGKTYIYDNIETRKENVKKTGFADLIIEESYNGQKIDDIIKYNADLFVIGDDWLGKFDYLKKYCDVIYLPRTPGISSSQLRKALKNA